MATWQGTLSQVGFQPFGSLGAMRAVVEDVEAVAIENGSAQLSFTVSHVGPRSAMQYEVISPLDLTPQEAAQVLVDAYERAHPQNRND